LKWQVSFYTFLTHPPIHIRKTFQPETASTK